MKGLVIKNLYTIVRKNEKVIIMVLLVNALMMTMLPDFYFLVIFSMFFTSALVQDQIGEEEKLGFSNFEKALPVSYRNIVFSRYLTAFAFIIVGAAASIVTTAFVDFMFDYEMNIFSFALSSLIFAYVSFVVLCVLLPFYYRYGTKHIRLISIVMLVVPTVANYFFGREGYIPGVGFNPIFIVVLALLSLCIVVFSVYLSLKIMKKR